MDIKSKGDIAQFKRHERTHGERNIILELLKDNSIESVSEMVHKDISEVRRIIELE